MSRSKYRQLCKNIREAAKAAEIELVEHPGHNEHFVVRLRADIHDWLIGSLADFGALENMKERGLLTLEGFHITRASEAIAGEFEIVPSAYIRTLPMRKP